MKQNLFLIACMAILFASCTKKSYTVSGVAPDEVKYVYFTYNYFDEQSDIDSVAVADGKFTIMGENDTPRIVSAALDNNTQFWFISEPGDITIDPELYLPSGTPQNDALADFFKKAEEIDDPEALTGLLDDFIAQHPNDQVGAFCLFMCSQYVGLPHTAELLEQCGDIVKKTVGKVITPEQIEAALETAKVVEATSEGKMFVDFEAEYAGKVQHLSDYVGKGKYVLVDFWASWCGPCRGEIPTIIEVYNKYAGDRFEVLGVATWDKPEDTQAAIEELGIKYPQIMNAQKAGSDAYGIDGIPQIILFGPDGTILKRDLRGEGITKAVEEALNL